MSDELTTCALCGRPIPMPSKEEAAAMSVLAGGVPAERICEQCGVEKLSERLGIEASPFGATGKYPDGKLRHEDEGELKVGLAVNHEQNVIELNFGKAICWIALERGPAIEFAKAILKKAEELKP